jgi:hypothetical protein
VDRRPVPLGHALKAERGRNSSEGDEPRSEMQTLQQKPKKFFRFLNTIFTTLRHRALKIQVRVGILGEDCCASVGVAHIDLIEHVIECLPTLHLAVQTA